MHVHTPTCIMNRERGHELCTLTHTFIHVVLIIVIFFFPFFRKPASLPLSNTSRYSLPIYLTSVCPSYWWDHVTVMWWSHGHVHSTQGVFLKTATVSDDFFLCKAAIKQQIVSPMGREGVGTGYFPLTIILVQVKVDHRVHYVLFSSCID